MAIPDDDAIIYDEKRCSDCDVKISTQTSHTKIYETLITSEASRGH